MPKNLLNYEPIKIGSGEQTMNILAMPEWFFKQELKKITKTNQRSKVIMTLWDLYFKNYLKPRKMPGLKYLTTKEDYYAFRARRTIKRITKDIDDEKDVVDQFYDCFIKRDLEFSTIDETTRPYKDLLKLSIIADKTFTATTTYKQLFHYGLGLDYYGLLWPKKNYQLSPISLLVVLEKDLISPFTKRWLRKGNPELNDRRTERIISNILFHLSNNEEDKKIKTALLARAMETEYLNIYHQISMSYYQKIKNRIPSSVALYFLTLNTKQQFWGDRICRYDLKNGLISMEYLSKMHFFDYFLPCAITNASNNNDKYIDIKKIISLYLFVASQRRSLARLSDNKFKQIKTWLNQKVEIDENHDYFDYSGKYRNDEHDSYNET